MSEVITRLDELFSRLNISDKKEDILESYRTITRNNVLVSIDLIRTGITELPEDVFNQFSKVKKIFLSHNPIGNLPVGIFSKLPHLEHLDLRSIELSKLCSDLFANQQKMKRLELNDNKIIEVPKGIFDNLYALEELNLANNDISYLDPELFDNLVHLKRLYLYFNPLPGNIAHGDYYDRDAVEEVIATIKRKM